MTQRSLSTAYKMTKTSESKHPASEYVLLTVVLLLINSLIGSELKATNLCSIINCIIIGFICGRSHDATVQTHFGRKWLPVVEVDVEHGVVQ